MNNFIKLDLEKLSYKIIKEKISEISISENYKTEELKVIIKKLLSDKRKNVSSLGKTLERHLESYIKEVNRVKSMYAFDKSFGDIKYVAGVDEVGRGPLAGPIVACAVILDLNAVEDELILYLNDSKKLNHAKREELSEIIKKKAIAYHIAFSSNEEIDEKGIAFCNNNVFLESCNNLSVKPNLVLSDGYRIKNIDVANEFVIKGDTKSASIAAASILAKVYRDNLMVNYSKEYIHYDFENNMGYGTQKHIDGLKKYGKCKIHRNSFLNNIL